jgi:chorismate--pyruvate lyase
MYARSVFPESTLQGNTRYLRYALDERPLGDLLYRDPTLKRTDFEIACLKDIYLQPLWARRSAFFIQNKPILLTEVFMPALLRSN